MTLSNLRRDYPGHPLRKSDVSSDPFEQFDRWFQEALANNVVDANAMTVATASAQARPSARTVLLKGYSRDGFVFFTDYESLKGKHLAENPQACLLFYWADLNRQVRIHGGVQKVTPEESDIYFRSRPPNSRRAALISRQSQSIGTRKELEERMAGAIEYEDDAIPRPERWGGYRVEGADFEFWQGRPSRLHDRLHYFRDQGGRWQIERLCP